MGDFNLTRLVFPEEHRETGVWWDRTLVGDYLPPISRGAAMAPTPELQETLP